MLLPDKHIRFAESLLGLGAFVLEELERPKSLDALWAALRNHMEKQRMPATHTFDNLVLAVDVLFAIGAVTLNPDGRLNRCTS